mgnify:CR=1 FL=1
MADEPIQVTDPHRVGVTFVNQVIGIGHANGVVNVAFATALFSVGPDGKVVPDLVVSSRLRMDLWCVQQLHDQLARILAQNVKTTGTPH